MTTIVTFLAEGFADWETALLNAAARTYYGVDVRIAGPSREPITSMGGLRVTPGMALDEVDLDAIDALVISGGTAWAGPQAPDIKAAVLAAHQKGKVVAGICDGTTALARTGLLDAVDHTSNGVGYLDATGYGGKSRYRDVAGAVSDQRIVTAPATAPVRFMEAVFTELGLADDQLRFYTGLYAAEHNAKRPG